jgi:hypothetical protein
MLISRKQDMKVLRIGILTIVGLGLMGCGDGESLASRQDALVAPRQMHVIAVTSAGGIRHAVRTNTTWSGFGDVESAGAAGELGTISRVAVASGRAGLHVVALNSDNSKLFHTIRASNGSWLSWGNINNVIGNLGSHTSVGLAESNIEDAIFLCTTTSDGKAWLTSRNGTSGVWSSVTDLKVATNSNPGTFTNISCQAEATGPTQQRLHILATTNDGQMWHAVRSLSSTWTQFGNVNQTTGSTAFFRDVDAVADLGQNLQVVGTGTGFQHHAARFSANGTWTAFGDIASVATDPGSERRGATVSLDDGVHVFVTTSTGGLFRALRRPDTTWQAYTDVRAENGSAESVTDVAVAADVPAQISSFSASGVQTANYIVTVKGTNFRPLSSIKFFYDNPVAGAINFMNVISKSSGALDQTDTSLNAKACSALKMHNTEQFFNQNIRAVGPDGETAAFTTSSLFNACSAFLPP